MRPPAQLGDYKGVEVGRREPRSTTRRSTPSSSALRESLASLETVERAAGDGDFVVIDFAGSVDGEPFEGGEARGHLVELGSGRLIQGFEEQLEGASAGDERRSSVTFPDDYRPSTWPARKPLRRDVKEVKEKRLPELDDDFAVEAGGFDTLDELRADIEARLREADEQRDRGRVPRGGGRRGRGGGEDRRPHELVARARRTRCGTGPRTGSPPRASTRSATSR